VDISWLMCLLAAGASYYLMGKGIDVDRERSAVISREIELGGYAPAAGE
jgi:hypothetical protein